MTAGELLRAVHDALSATGAGDGQCVAIVRKVVDLAETPRVMLPTATALDTCLARERRNARIRALARRGVDERALAARFGLSHRQVKRILKRKTPKWARTCISVSTSLG